MFDNVLQIVKEQIGSDPKAAAAIPPEHADEVHREIANGVTDGMKDNATGGGGMGGMLSSVTGNLDTGSLAPKISQAVSQRLNGKFGLSQDAIQSITSAIPNVLKKFTGK